MRIPISRKAVKIPGPTNAVVKLTEETQLSRRLSLPNAPHLPRAGDPAPPDM